ncbi:MAG TPA: hypothetical protein VFU22_13645 [Roseiflexaceae bacterium]|nr:hypothetical protein [Roseiflexaceae bacterium]
MNKIRVLIADDHVLFRDRLRALLASMEEAELGVAAPRKCYNVSQKLLERRV